MSIRFTKIKKELDLDDGMPFGKYQGIPLARVIKDDPKYFLWMLENSEMFFCTEEVMQFYEEQNYKKMLKDLQQNPFIDFDEEDIPF